ncbi:MAG: hypothetical protein J1F38_10235 [Muribaculaceae bacterium]|nr:hypothetical protein [Muribaculaceae bacterium]
MKAYIALYWDIHQAKLERAFKNIPGTLLLKNISVIDWGCGQGLASILFNDFIIETYGKNKIKDFTLIEPSRHCLSMATTYLNDCTGDFTVYFISEKEEDIEINDFILEGETIVHLLSNVVDMPEFEGNQLIELIKQKRQKKHLLVCVSPFYPEDGRGKRMDEFGDRLSGFKTIYLFEKHVDDWNENYSCQIRIFSNI